MAQLLLGVIYLSFISLGLPDSLLGAAWPAICAELHTPLSYAGAVSLIIAVGTVISSLQSDRLTRALGTGKVTALSVALTALALYGFSISRSFLALCLWAIPYGLGAGSVDASLNNYVALHYASRHMSWLHCMWGVGASVGPYLMGYALSGGMGWNQGYRTVALIQIAVTAVLFFSSALWKKPTSQGKNETNTKTLTLRQITRIPGAWACMACFFCYCAVEQTAGLWASSFLTLGRGMPAEKAASFASLFFLGITAGRALCGFATLKWSDAQLTRIGLGGIGLGVLVLALPLGAAAACVGLGLIGFGCAPVYPSMIHATPSLFGAENSQAIIGVQMASAYVGTCVMPPLFGLLAGWIGVTLLPYFLLVVLLVMGGMFERVNRACAVRP